MAGTSADNGPQRRREQSAVRSKAMRPEVASAAIPESAHPRSVDPQSVNLAAANTPMIEESYRPRIAAGLRIAEGYCSIVPPITLPALVFCGNPDRKSDNAIAHQLAEALTAAKVPFRIDHDPVVIGEGGRNPIYVKVGRSAEALNASFWYLAKSTFKNLFAPDLKLPPNDEQQDRSAAMAQWASAGISAIMAAVSAGGIIYTIANAAAYPWMTNLAVIGFSIAIPAVFARRFLLENSAATARRITLRVKHYLERS